MQGFTPIQTAPNHTRPQDQARHRRRGTETLPSLGANQACLRGWGEAAPTLILDPEYSAGTDLATGDSAFDQPGLLGGLNIPHPASGLERTEPTTQTHVNSAPVRLGCTVISGTALQVALGVGGVHLGLARMVVTPKAAPEDRSTDAVVPSMTRGLRWSAGDKMSLFYRVDYGAGRRGEPHRAHGCIPSGQYGPRYHLQPCEETLSHSRPSS